MNTAMLDEFPAQRRTKPASTSRRGGPPPDEKRAVRPRSVMNRSFRVRFLLLPILALAAKTRVRVPLTQRIVKLVKAAEMARAGSPMLTPEQIKA